jgi:acyl carrier protein
MEVVDAVTQFIVDQFAPDVRASDIDPDYDLLETGIIDSLGLLTALAWIEEEFGCEVDYGDVNENDFRSVRAICELIERTAATTRVSAS